MQAAARLLRTGVGKQPRGESMTRTRTSVLGATFFLLAGALALALVLLTGRSSGGNQLQIKVGAGAAGVTSK